MTDYLSNFQNPPTNYNDRLYTAFRGPACNNFTGQIIKVNGVVKEDNTRMPYNKYEPISLYNGKRFCIKTNYGIRSKEKKNAKNFFKPKSNCENKLSDEFKKFFDEEYIKKKLKKKMKNSREYDYTGKFLEVESESVKDFKTLSNTKDQQLKTKITESIPNRSRKKYFTRKRSSDGKRLNKNNPTYKNNTEKIKSLQNSYISNNEDFETQMSSKSEVVHNTYKTEVKINLKHNQNLSKTKKKYTKSQIENSSFSNPKNSNLLYRSSGYSEYSNNYGSLEKFGDHGPSVCDRIYSAQFKAKFLNLTKQKYSEAAHSSKNLKAKETSNANIHSKKENEEPKKSFVDRFSY